MSNISSIPARELSVDEVADRALAMARGAEYYDNAAIAAGAKRPTLTWDDQTPEQQVALLNHCVGVVRRINKRRMVHVNTTR